MLALGIILVLLAVGALIAALTGGSNDPATFDLGLFEVQTHTLGVFLIGAFTVLLLVAGLELLRTGVRRARRQRQDRKRLTRLEQTEAQREAGGPENDRSEGGAGVTEQDHPRS